jgi:hypothetical protein
MTTTKCFPLFAALLVSGTAYAQQATTPQPTQQQTAATTSTPCKSTAPAQPHKPGWLEKKARDLACKKNANLCQLPSSADDAVGTTQTAKPCTQSPAPKPSAPPATPAPQTPAPTAKPAYVCPPRTVLIANTPYCLAADQTTVDAIPLPLSLAVPVSPVKTPAQTTTKQ